MFYTIVFVSFITLLGLTAAAITTISFLPQVIRCYTTKKTKAISSTAYILLECGSFLWLTYGILINDLPIITANTLISIFVALILIMKYLYK